VPDDRERVELEVASLLERHADALRFPPLEPSLGVFSDPFGMTGRRAAVDHLAPLCERLRETRKLALCESLVGRAERIERPRL
jgi:hypothetical protein